MNSVGIDVSKGKSTVCVLKPYGEVIVSPCDFLHSLEDTDKLVNLIKSLWINVKKVDKKMRSKI